jgi:hypothetical protein
MSNMFQPLGHEKIEAEIREDVENRFPGLEECSNNCFNSPLKMLT